MSKPTFSLLELCGSGACASVYRALDHATGRHVAVKVVANPRFHKAALHEVQMMQDLAHRNIVAVLGCFQGQSKEIAIVQEYASHGDLFQMISDRALTEAQMRMYFAQLVDALEYLHTAGIVHRDVKPENVVIADGDVAKLCDFGMAQWHGHAARGGSGTVPYMAPEIVDAKPEEVFADKSHDVWAAAVTLFVLATGSFPWRSAAADDEDYAAFLIGDLSSDAWQLVSTELIAILARAFRPRTTRCTMADLRAALSVPWFAPAPELSDEGLCASRTSLLVHRSEPMPEKICAFIKKPRGWSMRLTKALKPSPFWDSRDEMIVTPV